MESNYVRIEIANATAKLSAIVMSEAETLDVYDKRLQDIFEDLDGLGQEMTTSEQATAFLNSLNTYYSTNVSSFQLWSRTAPALYNINDIVSSMIQNDVRADINGRKRGEPARADARINYGSGARPGGRHDGGGGSGVRDLHGI